MDNQKDESHMTHMPMIGGIVVPPNVPMPNGDLRPVLLDLLSQMFSKPAANIHLSELIKTPAVASITTNMDIVRQVLLDVKTVTVVEDIVRSNLKPEQNTLILRDIAEGAVEQDIIRIFTISSAADGTPCPPLKLVRPDMNETWFVTFESESDARLALQAISNTEINGKKVKARLKTESMVKYQAPPSNYIPYRGEAVPAPPSNPAMLPNMYMNTGGFSPGAPPTPVFSNQVMYPTGSIVFPQPLSLAIPQGNFAPYPMQAPQSPVGYQHGVAPFQPVHQQQQPQVQGRGNYQNYSPQTYPAGSKFNGGNRGGRPYRGGGSTPNQMTGSGNRYSNGGYRPKNSPGEVESTNSNQGDAGNRGFRGYPAPSTEPLPVGQPYAYPGQVYVNGFVRNGYVDPMVQQQMFQHHPMAQSHDEGVEKVLASSSDHESDTRGTIIYFAGKTTPKGTGKYDGEGFSKAQGLEQDVVNGTASMTLSSLSTDKYEKATDENVGAITDEATATASTDQTQRGGRNGSNRNTYSRKDRNSNTNPDGSTPRSTGYDGDRNHNGRRGNGYHGSRGNNRSNPGTSGGFQSNSQGSLSAQYTQQSDGSGKVKGQQHDNSQRGKNLRGSNTSNARNTKTDQDGRGHKKDKVHAPQFNLESDFPTLLDENNLPIPSRTEGSSDSVLNMKGGYAAALKNTAVKPISNQTENVPDNTRLVETSNEKAAKSFPQDNSQTNRLKFHDDSSIDATILIPNQHKVHTEIPSTVVDKVSAPNPVIIFGSFSPEAIEPPMKTVFVPNPTISTEKMTNISFGDMQVPVAASSSLNNHTNSHSDAESASTSKRSFLDVVRSKAAA